MKAEHRHELKTNDLAKSLVSFGDYAREYGGRVALGLAIVILVIVLIRNRIQNSKAEALRVRDDLALAHQQVGRLRYITVDRDGVPSVVLTDSQIQDVKQILKNLKEKAPDKAIRAEAAVLEGDFYWSMATYPNVTGTRENPVTPPGQVERNEYVKQARQAYQQVLEQFGDQAFSVVAARFGLGVLAENSSDWAAAKAQYEAIRAMPDAFKEYKNLAEYKLKRLEEIQKPVLVGEVPEKFIVPTPATLPSTLPATTQSATAPTTTAVALPTTKPKDPETKPATPEVKKPPATKAAPATKPSAKPSSKPATTKPAPK